jgi:hypothetical protein
LFDGWLEGRENAGGAVARGELAHLDECQHRRGIQADQQAKVEDEGTAAPASSRASA